jgi:hypothetical protein
MREWVQDMSFRCRILPGSVPTTACRTVPFACMSAGAGACLARAHRKACRFGSQPVSGNNNATLDHSRHRSTSMPGHQHLPEQSDEPSDLCKLQTHLLSKNFAALASLAFHAIPIVFQDIVLDLLSVEFQTTVMSTPSASSATDHAFG